MDLQTQVKFAVIYSNLKKEIHTLQDISQIITITRHNSKNISLESKKLLLSIPQCVLATQVELIHPEKKWANARSIYFAGNYGPGEMRSIFKSKNFDLSTIIDCMNDIMTSKTGLESDFLLRNPEVTLRDDVKILSYRNFVESGPIYAEIMQKAFNY